MLKERVLTTLITLPLLLAAVWFDRPIHWFSVLIALWGGAAVLEFYGMVSRAKTAPLTYLGLAFTMLFLITADPAVSHLIGTYMPAGAQTPSVLLAIAAVLPLTWLVWLKKKEDAFSRWVWTLAGIIYVGALLAHLIGLRGMGAGRNWVFFVFLTTFASDTSAFLCGRSMGRHKLAPNISPAKTWEGAVAGVIGATLIGLLFAPPSLGGISNPLHIPPLGYVSAAILALTVSVFGQFGDLVESLLKRNLRAKDSGRLLPGHGGALDRLDSVVFAGVVVYYYVVWLMR